MLAILIPQAVPFRTTKLDPLSPQPSGVNPDSMYPASPVLSPVTKPPENIVMGGSPVQHHPHHVVPPHVNLDLNGHAVLSAPGILNIIDEGHEGQGVLSPEPSLSLGALPPHQQSSGGCGAPGPPSGSAVSNSVTTAHGPMTPRQAGVTPSGITASGTHPVASYHGRCTNEDPSDKPAMNGCAQPCAGHGRHSTSPKSFPLSSSLAAHISHIRQELGEGEGVTELLRLSSVTHSAVTVTEPPPPPPQDTGEPGTFLSDDDVAGGMPAVPPPSPRTKLRHGTYNATLDFLEALCDASASLVSISHVSSVCGHT